MVTDGLSQAYVLVGGRLWKNDRRSLSVLLFPGANAVVKLSRKGRLVVREMTGRHHDHGYDLALESVIARAADRPGHAPVIAPLGRSTLVTVLDMKAFSATFDAAE